jgi:hypothetical protein
MKWGRGALGAAVEKDLRRLQLLLPFAEEKTIDMARCCSILHCSSQVVDRLRVTPITPDSDTMCLRAYNTVHRGRWRIDYESLVQFLDVLRDRYAIRDRRPVKVFGRHRDEDLLPFPWSDTICVQDAADVLQIDASGVLLRIEEGHFEAYQFSRWSNWRISRSSFERYLASFGCAPSNARPYGTSETAAEAKI